MISAIFPYVVVVRDTDGSAFITKAEFDSLKNNFQAQIDNYNSSIDSKIDGAIASYLSGIQIANTTEIEPDLNVKNYYWINNFSLVLTPRTGQDSPRVDVWNGQTKIFKPAKLSVPIYLRNVYVAWGDYFTSGGSSMYFATTLQGTDDSLGTLDTHGRGITKVLDGSWNYSLFSTESLQPIFIILMKNNGTKKFPVLVRFGVGEIQSTISNGSLFTWSDYNRPILGLGHTNSVFGTFGTGAAGDYLKPAYYSDEGLGFEPYKDGVRQYNNRITWSIDKLVKVYINVAKNFGVFNDTKNHWGYVDNQNTFYNRDYKKLLLGNSSNVNEDVAMSFIQGALMFGQDYTSSSSLSVDTQNNTEQISGNFYINEILSCICSSSAYQTAWRNAFNNSKNSDNFVNIKLKAFTYRKINSIYNEQSVNDGYNLKITDGFPIYTINSSGTAKFSLKVNTSNNGTSATKVSFNSGPFTSNSSNMHKYNGETKLSETLYELSPDSNGEISIETHVERGDNIYVRLDPKDTYAINEAKVVDISTMTVTH